MAASQTGNMFLTIGPVHFVKKSDLSLPPLAFEKESRELGFRLYELSTVTCVLNNDNLHDCVSE